MAKSKHRKNHKAKLKARKKRLTEKRSGNISDMKSMAKMLPLMAALSDYKYK